MKNYATYRLFPSSIYDLEGGRGLYPGLTKKKDEDITVKLHDVLTIMNKMANFDQISLEEG